MTSLLFITINNTYQIEMVALPQNVRLEEGQSNVSILFLVLFMLVCGHLKIFVDLVSALMHYSITKNN